jgi:Ferritin-like
MARSRLRWLTYQVDVHPDSPTARLAGVPLPTAPAPGMVRAAIDLPDLSGYPSPREKADALLAVAAEVEHALLVQYLYAAYSLKKGTDSSLNPDQQKAVRKWKSTIVEIAKEEMGHLMTVQNLRLVLGLGPTFERDNCPMLPGLFPFDFHLGPINQKTLAEYVVAESPTDDTTHPALPDIIKVATGQGGMPVNHVGNLYGLLGVIFAASLDDINRDASGKDPWYVMVRDIAAAAYQQDPSASAWHLNGDQFDARTLRQQASAADFSPMTPGGVLSPLPPPAESRLWQCANQGDAKAALRDIGLQGEGPAQGPPAGETSHFERFYAIYTGDDGVLPFPKDEWMPTYAAPTDPVISDDVDNPNAITEPKAQDYARLADQRYALILGLLNQYLVTDPDRRVTLKLSGWAVTEMDSLSGLARALADLPRSKAGPGGGNAALPFALPSVLTPPVAQADQWGLLIDRLQEIIDQENRIVSKYNDTVVANALQQHKPQLEMLKQQVPES